ncbi:MAG: alpha/beta hydrolase [Thermoguttaceae bacterium]
MSEKTEYTAIQSETASSLLSQSGGIEQLPKKDQKKKGQGDQKGQACKRNTDVASSQLDLARVSGTAGLEHLLFSPMHYEPGYAYPLLVWLHGRGNDERQILKIMPLISMRNFVGIAPRGLPVASSSSLTKVCSIQPNSLFQPGGMESKRYYWNFEDSDVSDAEQKIFESIDLAKERCHIASNRVFLGGFEDGGSMALRIGMHFPDYFSGIISLGGRFPTGNVPFRQWTSIRNLPIMLAIGSDSAVYTPENAFSDLKLLHTAGLSVSARQYSCTQEIHPEMLQNMNRWMMDIVCR